MTSSEPRQSSRLGLTIGLMALAGGLWLFLNAQDAGIPQFKDMWPALLLLGGVSSLVDLFFLSRKPSAAGWALAWTGFGILAFALTLGHTDWSKILDWLPSFPTIIGLAFITTWLVDRRKNDNLLIAGAVLTGLGLIGFGARFDWLKRILPSAQVLWAVLLLAGGGFLVWRTVSQARRKTPESRDHGG